MYNYIPKQMVPDTSPSRKAANEEQDREEPQENIRLSHTGPDERNSSPENTLDLPPRSRNFLSSVIVIKIINTQPSKTLIEWIKLCDIKAAHSASLTGKS